MNRQAIVGLVLLLLGIVFGVTGYERMRPTGLEKTLEFAASISGQQVPTGLRRDKSDAYLTLAAGVGLSAAGVWLLMRRSRAS
jgi:hypothetical protein